MQEIMNIVYSNTLGVEKLLAWLSGGSNIFLIQIAYLDLLVVSIITLIYIRYLMNTMKKQNVRAVDFTLRTILVMVVIYFVVGSPLGKDVGFIEGNAYTHYYFSKALSGNKTNMDTAQTFRKGYIIESPPADNQLFGKGGGMGDKGVTVYIDSSDIGARFTQLGDAKSYEYDKNFLKAGITEAMFNVNINSGSLFSLPKTSDGQTQTIDPRAEKIKSCVTVATPGAICTDWGFIFDERKMPVSGFVKLKETYKDPNGNSMEDFGRMSFLNDYELGYIYGNSAATNGSELYIVDRKDIFYWKVMAIHDMSADKQGGSMALDFYIIPNLYSLKLDRDISANNVSADSDGYSPDILKATTSDFLKEKERQCKALGKDTCTFADIYQAKARSAGTGKINAFLSAFSITANGFNLSNDGTHRTVSINGREYLTFVGLYEMLREKAAKPFSLERSIVGANFASSSNVMALVTTDDGTPDGTLSRDVYPLGAFQKGSLYSAAYSISSDSGIGIWDSILLAIFGLLFIVVTILGAGFPIILVYTFLH